MFYCPDCGALAAPSRGACCDDCAVLLHIEQGEREATSWEDALERRGFHDYPRDSDDWDDFDRLYV
ncbi:hypothetical protein SEA_GREENWEASEL_77 [Streptomyces phage GreenWeasel]|nr:hypothetical protein SEA_GREENWEASEL_77 [Streptomyces phage GreenWeasel]